MPVMDFNNDVIAIEFWQVSKTGNQPFWVQEAFEKKYFQWVDKHLRILVSGLNPDWWQQSGRYLGYGMYVQANVGDIIDRTNCQILTEKAFIKRYGTIPLGCHPSTINQSKGVCK